MQQLADHLLTRPLTYVHSSHWRRWQNHDSDHWCTFQTITAHNLLSITGVPIQNMHESPKCLALVSIFGRWLLWKHAKDYIIGKWEQANLANINGVKFCIYIHTFVSGHLGMCVLERVSNGLGHVSNSTLAKKKPSFVNGWNSYHGKLQISK